MNESISAKLYFTIQIYELSMQQGEPFRGSPFLKRAFQSSRTGRGPSILCFGETSILSLLIQWS